jgi:hypothetical protein
VAAGQGRRDEDAGSRDEHARPLAAGAAAVGTVFLRGLVGPATQIQSNVETFSRKRDEKDWRITLTDLRLPAGPD